MTKLFRYFLSIFLCGIFLCSCSEEHATAPRPITEIRSLLMSTKWFTTSTDTIPEIAHLEFRSNDTLAFFMANPDKSAFMWSFGKWSLVDSKQIMMTWDKQKFKRPDEIWTITELNEKKFYFRRSANDSTYRFTDTRVHPWH